MEKCAWRRRLLAADHPPADKSGNASTRPPTPSTPRSLIPGRGPRLLVGPLPEGREGGGRHPAVRRPPRSPAAERAPLQPWHGPQRPSAEPDLAGCPLPRRRSANFVRGVAGARQRAHPPGGANGGATQRGARSRARRRLPTRRKSTSPPATAATGTGAPSSRGPPPSPSLAHDPVRGSPLHGEGGTGGCVGGGCAGWEAHRRSRLASRCVVLRGGRRLWWERRRCGSLTATDTGWRGHHGEVGGASGGERMGGPCGPCVESCRSRTVRTSPLSMAEAETQPRFRACQAVACVPHVKMPN